MAFLQCCARYREHPDSFFYIFFDIFLTSLMLGNWQLANQGADNFVRRSRSPSVISNTKNMATYQVKVKYGEERFRTFLIKDISFAKLMQAIKQNCSPLAHLPASNIRVRYRDEDGDMNNLSEDPDDFAFGEMLRSAKEVKARDFGKIFLQASEVDSPLPRKLRRMDVEMPSSSASNEFKSLQPKHLSFTPTPGAHLATTTAPKNCRGKSFGLPATGNGRKS